MHRARFWILCAIVALVVILGVLLLGTRDQAANIKSLKNMLPANVDMRLDNLVLSEAGAEGRQMTINASSAHYYKTQDIFVLDKVRADVISGELTYFIEADSGQYEPGSEIVNLYGNIKIVDTLGRVLLTSRLMYNKNNGLMHSDQEFCLTGPDLDLEGTSFTYNTKDGHLNAAGRVHLFVMQ